LTAPISLRIFSSCHYLYVGCMTAVYLSILKTPKR
jgi:hypothetical protein